MKDQRPHITIGILMFNEQDSIMDMYDELDRCLVTFKHSYEILFINNGSTDNTQRLIHEISKRDPHVSAVQILNNKGYGNGIIEGLSKAKGRFIGYCWGDNQVKASDILKTFETALKNPSSLVKIKRTFREDGKLRSLGSAIYNKLFARLFKVATFDANGCPKVFSRELFDKMTLKRKDWLIDPEIMYKASVLGTPIIEVPIIFQKRAKGRSYVTIFTFITFFAKLMLAYFRKEFEN